MSPTFPADPDFEGETLADVRVIVDLDYHDARWLWWLLDQRRPGDCIRGDRCFAQLASAVGVADGKRLS